MSPAEENDPTPVAPIVNPNPRPIPLREQYISDEHPNSPWAKKTVITFDGGGIRGYSSLLILQRLMTKIKDIEMERNRSCQSSKDYPWMNENTAATDRNAEISLGEFLPCHYFDYIAGTSTGGLSAIMLGRLRMSVDEALGAYVKFGQEVFGKARWWNERSIPPFWTPRSKYASRRTRAVFKQIIHDKLLKDNSNSIQEVDTEPFKYRADRTRTLVFSFMGANGVTNITYPWRTYDNDEDEPDIPRSYPIHSPSPAHTTPIWQVARATSAAPTYFESIKIGEEEHVDGGLGANNPSIFTLREIRSMHDHPPALFISIGCGKKVEERRVRSRRAQIRDFLHERMVDNEGHKRFPRKWLDMGRDLKRFLTDVEGPQGVAGWLPACVDAGIPGDRCCRFNVEGDIANIRLDEWNPSESERGTLNRIRTLTNEYLSKQEISAKIEDMATVLVDIRHQRARTERWEAFATDVTYRCPGNDCHNRVYKKRRKFRDHVNYSGKHDDIDTTNLSLFNSYLDSGRR